MYVREREREGGGGRVKEGGRKINVREEYKNRSVTGPLLFLVTGGTHM